MSKKQTDPTITDETFTTPDAKVIDKAIEEYDTIDRNYVELPDNFADDEDTAKAFLKKAYNHYTTFVSQTSRNDLITYLKDADAKFRLSKDNQYNDKSTQESNTLSHVASPQFYNSVKRIWTGLVTMIFGDGQEIPARYEKLADTEDYTAQEGERIAKEQSLCFETLYKRHQWEVWLKDSMFWLTKNAHEFIGLEWAYETDTRKERLPGFYTKSNEPMETKLVDGKTIVVKTGKVYIGQGYDQKGKSVKEIYNQNGKPVSYVFTEKTRLIQNNPIPIRYNLEDVYLDLDIKSDVIDPNKDAIQRQSCIIIHDQVTLDELIAGERDDLYKNVSEINENQLFEYAVAQNGETDLRNEKDKNADQTTDTAKNGLYDRWHIMMRSPINPETGKWDAAKNIPAIYEAVVIGRMSEPPVDTNKDGKRLGPICIMLRKNPYDHKRFPYKMIFSDKDDRASVHMGIYTLLECNMEEQTTTMNQHIDCKTLRIKKPWLRERGSVESKNLIFKNGNQVIDIKPGTSKTALTQLEVEDVTGSTMPTLQYLSEQADKTVDTNDAVQGEYAGSRTTASEALSVKDQALQPAIERAKYVAAQYFYFLCRDCADLVRQFADPDAKIPVTNQYGEIDAYVSPSELYGSLNVKIVTLEKYQADLTMRQNLNNFLQAGGYEQSKPFMGESGALQFWRTYGKFMKMPDVEKIYPPLKKNMEAENQAWSDVSIILADPTRAMQDESIMPKKGEQHDIHIGILQQERDKLAVLIPTMEELDREQAQLSLQALDLYILMHNQFAEAEKSEATMQQASVSNQSANPPSMGGEATGDVISGEMGQVAQGV